LVTKYKVTKSQSHKVDKVDKVDKVTKFYKVPKYQSHKVTKLQSWDINAPSPTHSLRFIHFIHSFTVTDSDRLTHSLTLRWPGGGWVPHSLTHSLTLRCLCAVTPTHSLTHSLTPIVRHVNSTTSDYSLYTRTLTPPSSTVLRSCDAMSFAMSFARCNVMSFARCNVMSFARCNVMSFARCNAMSFTRCNIVRCSQCRSRDAMSFARCNVVRAM